MKKYEEPIFQISHYDLEDAILSSVGVVDEVYSDNDPFRVFD